MGRPLVRRSCPVIGAVSGAALAPRSDDDQEVVYTVRVAPALNDSEQVVDTDRAIAIEVAIAWDFNARGLVAGFVFIPVTSNSTALCFGAVRDARFTDAAGSGGWDIAWIVCAIRTVTQEIPVAVGFEFEAALLVDAAGSR